MNKDKLIGRKMIPQFSTTKECYLSQNNMIVKYDYKSGKIEDVCILPSSSKSLVNKIKLLVQRTKLYRSFISKAFGIGHISLNAQNVMLIIYDEIYSHKLNEPNEEPHRTNLLYKSNVAPPLRNGIAVHPESNCFYFGEYKNDYSKSIAIVRVNPTADDLEIVYEFEPGIIKHIHGIFFDKYRNRLWVTTGDRDEACCIYYSDDEFKTLHKLGGGDQSWRAVSLMIEKDRILWGMDAGKDAPASAINYIWSYDFNTNKKERHIKIGNPAYHALVSDKGTHYLGVNFEPGRKQKTDERSSIWKSGIGNSSEFTQIRDFGYQEVDITGCSKYGYIYFPSGLCPEGEVLYAAIHSDKNVFGTYKLNE